jgi:hypothetical protein
MKTMTIAMAATLFACMAFKPAPGGNGKAGSWTGNTGLYLTPDDFQHNKLSYAGAAAGGQTRIKLHDGLFGSTTVDLIYDGKKQVFSTARVYGYRDSKGQDYRFFERGTYQILDTAGFYLYSGNKLVQGEKIARPKTLYYFSVKGVGDVQPLTLGNLENAFAGNARFRYEIEAMQGKFGSDVALAAYDEVLKVYKIKYLYSHSL